MSNPKRVDQGDRLPFYKTPQPKSNNYQFDKNDVERIPVMQKFKSRNSQVSEGGRANQAGIKLGDSIVKINETDTKNMSLTEAHQRIQSAGNDIKLSVKRFVYIIVIFLRLTLFFYIFVYSFEDDEIVDKSIQEHNVNLVQNSGIEKQVEVDRSKCFHNYAKLCPV